MIYVLCVDALDYELVQKLNLKNLKQLEYNKIEVPINEIICLPMSADVWASFLIGKNISIDLKSSSNLINIILKLLYAFNIKLLDDVGNKIKKVFKKIGISAPARFKGLNQKTFIDLTNSKDINFPYYGFDHATFDVGYKYSKEKISIRQLIKEMNNIYEDRKKQFINELNSIENADVVVAYMHVIDYLQHLLLRVSDIERYYIDLDNYIPILKNKIEESFGEVIFIIVSDHGFDFDKGNHSMMGFYSSNTALNPRPDNIIDFYGIIIELVNKKRTSAEK